eukprot:2140149-Alexandrium_andersonii.AAC.1
MPPRSRQLSPRASAFASARMRACSRVRPGAGASAKWREMAAASRCHVFHGTAPRSFAYSVSLPGRRRKWRTHPT